MKQVKSYYDSYWQEDRWSVKSVDPESGDPVEFTRHEVWFLTNHGFTIITPNTACNDTIIGHSEHSAMARDLNR